MAKHSNIYYIRVKQGGFMAAESAKTYKNNMGLDLFEYRGGISEGRSGLRLCNIGDLDSFIERSGGLDGFKSRIEDKISRLGVSPRYTRPDECKQDVFRSAKN